VDVRPNWKRSKGCPTIGKAFGLGQVMSLLFIERCLPTVSPYGADRTGLGKSYFVQNTTTQAKIISIMTADP
jgi:hypothetical protein